MTLLPPPPSRPEVTQEYARAWAHFSKRLRERHGLTIGLIEYTRLCLEIGEQDLLLSGIALSNVSRRDVLLRVRIQGVTVPCVWRVGPGVLVTVYAHAMTESDAQAHGFNRGSSGTPSAGRPSRSPRFCAKLNGQWPRAALTAGTVAKRIEAASHAERYHRPGVPLQAVPHQAPRGRHV